MRVWSGLLVLAAGALASCPFGGFRDGPMPSDHVKVGAEGHPKMIDSREVLCPHNFSETPDRDTTTVNGCECETPCHATVDFGLSKCDWCYTKHSCGHFSITRNRHYDYCVYKENPRFEALSWQDKSTDLWAKITADSSLGSYPPVAAVTLESIQTTFDDHWDYLPAGRKKYIHSVGAVCKIRLDISEKSPYTGLLSPGSVHGFIRMGPAVKLDENGLNPGIGYKFFRTGVRSGNFVSLHKLDVGFTWDFFSVSQSNHIATPTGAIAILGEKFAQASGCVNMVGLSDLCMYDQEGNKATELNFPYQINLDPLVNFPDTQDDLAGIMKRFSTIANSTTLFKISMKSSPTAPAVELGSLVTESECVTSKYGDEKLMIRHQRVEEDWSLRPDWIKDIPDSACFPNKPGTPAPAKCENKKGRFALS